MYLITTIYASALAMGYLGLSATVIIFRYRLKISFGHGDTRRMETLVRAHGNFAEYVPFGLILLLLAEAQGTASWWLHMIGALLLSGRLAHGWALTRRHYRELPHYIGVIRVSGMVLTFTAIAFAIAACLRPLFS